MFNCLLLLSQEGASQQVVIQIRIIKENKRRGLIPRHICVVIFMEFTELFSYYTDCSEATFNPGFDPVLYSILFADIKIQGVPAIWGQEQIEDALMNEAGRIPLGSIFGYLILGEHICSIGGDILKYADAINSDLLNVVSAFTGKKAPYSENANLFYISEFGLIENIDKENLQQLIEELPDRLFAHFHIEPDVIIISPSALPRRDEFELFKEAGYTKLNETSWFYK